MSSENRTRILVVSQYRDESVGGAERYISEVCARLSKSRFDMMHIATDIQPRAISRPYRLLTTGLNLKWLRELTEIIRSFSPDVLYVHLTVPFLPEIAIKCAKTAGVPVLATYHGDVTGASALKRAAGLFYRVFVGRKALARASTVIACSEAYHAASPMLATTQTRVIYLMPGVSPDFFLPPQTPERYILFVGKPLLKSKGFRTLYEAWRTLRLEFPDVTLRVAGSSYCDDFPDVDYLGYVNNRTDLGKLYGKALVTVLPSVTTAESFGMVLAESLAAGCPVIGSSITGATSLIREGVNGYSFVAGSATDLRRALSQSIANNGELRARIRKSSATYAELFSWENVSKAVSDELTLLAAQGGS